MNKNKRIFDALCKVIDINLFYTATVDKYDVKLQANYKPEIIPVIKMAKFDFNGFTQAGYMIFKRNKIEIVLT